MALLTSHTIIGVPVDRRRYLIRQPRPCFAHHPDYSSVFTYGLGPTEYNHSINIWSICDCIIPAYRASYDKMVLSWVLHEMHFTTTQIDPGFYIYTLERSFCLMINIMIDIRYISRCVIQVSKSVRFILHVLSSDYSFSSVHVKNLSPTAPKKTRGPDVASSVSRLIFMRLSWQRTKWHLQSSPECRTDATIRAGTVYIHQMSQVYSICLTLWDACYCSCFIINGTHHFDYIKCFCFYQCCLDALQHAQVHHSLLDHLEDLMHLIPNTRDLFQKKRIEKL